MRIIKGPTVTQVRIYPQDWIPYIDLAIWEKFNQFKEKFVFSNEEIPFPLYKPDTPKIVILEGGSVILDDEQILIHSLMLEERKITLIIETSSDKADLAFNKIANALKEIDSYKNFDPAKYLIKTEGTECTAQLDIDYHRFLSRQFNSFIKKQLPKYMKQKTTKITLKSFSFEIFFEQDKKLQEESISIAPKMLTIEPRKTTKEEDRTFYTISPCDSFTHFELLKQLEKNFKK
ncbi:MAG: hypothetical protein J7L08_03445 [Candidatus Aenigmarchaeota archaeon]|nr:hypothetical protein [Candidatus Aenigmarchaeota archaeon]